MWYHVQMELPSGQMHDCFLRPDFKVEKNFTAEELANTKAQEDFQLILYRDSLRFLDMIQVFRDWYSHPMHVNSCYRTPSFNKECGGSPNSEHLRSCALDWGKSGLTDAQREKYTAKWKEICEKYNNGRGQINYYTNGIHFGLGMHYTQFTVLDYRGKSGDW